MTAPPRIPPGARPFVYMSTDMPPKWTVRAQMPGEEQSSRCKRVSPVFALQTSAYGWLTWIEGGAEFVYPEGEA